MFLRGWLSPLSLLGLALLVGTCRAQHELHEEGMPEGLEVLDFKSEEEMDRVLFDPEKGIANFRSIVIGVYEKQCRHMVEEPWFTWGAVRHTDPRLMTVARIERKRAPQLVEVMEIPEYLCMSAVFVPRHGDRSNMTGFPADLEIETDYFDWVFQQMRVAVEFENVHDKPISLHYIQHGKMDSPSDHIIEAGERSDFFAFVGHVFLAREAEGGRLLDWMEVEGQGHYEVGKDVPPLCKMEKKGKGKGKEVCEDKEVTALRFVHGVLYRGRMSLNAIQPSRVAPFTKTGFERHKLPASVFGPIRDFWLTQQDRMMPEGSSGPVINQLESPTYLLVYPDEMKDRLFEGVRPLLEKWVDRSLEETACYGIRKYTNASRLLMHVDTMRTHAVSGIINVDQDVHSPWLLEILDHDGKKHDVSMEPGDIVFYESARLLHGRPKPMNGNYYANIFVHFRPTEGWDPLPL